MTKPCKHQGVELLKLEDTLYKTLDGRFEIYRDDEFETECDDPHPCRVTKNMRETFWKIQQDAYDRQEARHVTENRLRAAFGSAAYDAYNGGQKGWYCEGGEVHWYSQWVAWTGSDRDWTGEWADTFTDALADLVDHLNKHPEQRANEAQADTVRKIAASYVVKDITLDAEDRVHVKAAGPTHDTPVKFIVNVNGTPERIT